ncbi:MAG: phosphoribosylaminoimidazolesuccinocarboxamide synthase [Verrucomicrobia bacterium]|nr:MAG: phosphoribosylaminoimidazolesuccinocarboxamide synthase [Verrucomicrobiota bacterium]
MNYEQIAANLPETAVCEINDLPWPRISSGKVREIFDLGDRLLLVASDRISAFDVILSQGIPGKGIILTQLSLFWFEQLKDLVADHLVPDQESVLRDELKLSTDLQLRSMVVRKLDPLPIECVVRGYLAGSGWVSYQKDGTVCGHTLSEGLSEAERLPESIFTPTTKAHTGHDEPIDAIIGRKMVGETVFSEVEMLSRAVYDRGREIAAPAGIILADTKFEFGLDNAGTLFLIDEVLTPDSSRFWEAATYRTGMSPQSYDKQFVRDYLLTLDWDHKPPSPDLPDEIITKTQEKYLTALRRLTT